MLSLEIPFVLHLTRLEGKQREERESTVCVRIKEGKKAGKGTIEGRVEGEWEGREI